MDIIQKMTVEYHPLEDRLRLSVQINDSESYLLWMTAKLTVAAVAAILKTLDKSQPVYQVTERKPFQQWEQSAALLKFKAIPAVKAAVTRADLVQSVDISRRGENYALTFHGVNHTEARLSLTATQMRQWLQIVYQQFLQAKWSLAVWPAWFDRSQRLENPSQSTVLH